MGGSTSRPLQCVHGCWSSKSPNGDDDIDKKKKGSKSSRNQLKKLKLSDRELCACHWEEIPTPSVCEHRDTPVEGPPSQEKLIQIINCFPYPTPRTSPQPEQVIICEHMNNVDSENKSFGDAFEKLVQIKGALGLPN
nr:Protein LFE-2, isoform d [Haemonchus contortus]